VVDDKYIFVLIPREMEKDANEADQVYTFFCPSGGSKTKWVEELKRLVEAEKEKENIPEEKIQRKRSQLKLKPPTELLRTASRSKEIFNALGLTQGRQDLSNSNGSEATSSTSVQSELLQTNSRRQLRRAETVNEHQKNQNLHLKSQNVWCENHRYLLFHLRTQ